MAEHEQPNDITRSILDDHERIRRSFADLDDSSGDEERAQIWEHTAQLLETHAAAEEQIFYPSLLEVGTSAKDETEDAIHDHNEIRDAIRRARAAKTGSAEWTSALRDARKQNSDHMAEEERGALADFRRNAGEQKRRELGDRWAKFKDEHRGARGISEKNESPERYISEHAP